MSLEFKPKTQELKRVLFTLFPGLCKGCGLCIEKCPQRSLSWSDTLGVYGTPSVKANDACTACGICQEVCPDCAIRVERIKQEK